MRPSFASASSRLVIAALLVTAPMAARAQSFNATGSIAAGAGAIQTGPGTTTVFTDAPSVVINWTPTDTAIGGGPIDFQSAGTTATFSNRDATTLNVLNRIIPTDVNRPIVFNGTVTSQLVNLATGVASRGGTLFFYSPGGILVSSTGVFDVGNLALTASDLAFDTTSGAFGTSGTYSFLPANAGSQVELQKGARVTAGPISAYVALVAPKVINSGTINVDGSAVIVAADASTITFRPNGLFDIQIDQGTSATGEVVTNDGSIAGPAGTINTAHRVYMVAVPRNDAITMAIKAGSSLGFDVAGAADVDGNAVVLSAGFNVTGGIIDQVRAPASAAFPAGIALGAVTATSQITGRVTGQASLTVGAGETASLASNLDLAGVQDPAAATTDGAFISVGGIGSALDLKGNLQLSALDGGTVTNGGFTDSGGASVTVDGGTLSVGGTATISSSRAPAFAVDAVAGKATVTARNGAKVDFAQDLTITANATGLTRQDTPPGPNPGTGGEARLGIESGSAVTVGRSLVVSATGSGGSVTLAGLEGAAGTGGKAVIEGTTNAGTLVVTGTTLLDARAYGGAGLDCAACTVEGGAATGGTASLVAAKGANFTFGDTVSVDASARGGTAATDNGKDGGAAQGGNAFVRSDGGQVTSAQSLVARAEGTGGAGALFNNLASGSPGSGGAGGNGTGGTASITAGSGATIGGGGLISAVSDTLVSSVGTGGNGGTGGAGVGGSSAVSARNGTVSGSALVVRADGIGGNGFNAGSGGSGQGNAAQVIAYSALEGDAKVTFSGASVSARGDGGTGSSPAFFDGAGSSGGNGTGGSVSVLAEAGNGALNLGESSLNASGNGGSGGTGFTVASIPLTGQNGGAGGVGRAGSAQIGVVSGLDTGAVNTGSATLATITVNARGTGGSGGAPSAGASSPGAYGNGGNGFGGGATLFAQGGKVTFTAPGLFDAGGIGGNAGAGGTAGDGFVGDAGGAPVPLGARLEVGSRTGQPAQKGSLVATDLAFVASAETGKGGTPGNAIVLGRPLSWLMTGGTIDAGNLSFLAVGTPTASAPSSDIALAGGAVTLTGDLSFVTPSTLTASLDGVDVRAVNATLTASDWLEGLVPSGPVGTLFGSNSVALNTSGNLFAHLSANSGGALNLNSATGLVRLDDVTAVGDLGVSANTTISLGNVQAGGSALITAPGNVTVGNVGAVGSATVRSNAALVTGGVSSGQKIDLEGVTSISSGGAIQAGDSVLLNSDGTINAGLISAGLVSPSALAGATYNVTVFGRGGVTLGTIGAKGDVALLSPNAITSGSITGNEVAVLGAGNQLLGGITATGRVLLADYEMSAFGGSTLGSFSLAGVFAATPIVATSGLIALSGPANVGQLTAVSLGSIILQDVTATAAGAANGTVNLQAGGALGTGALGAGGRIDLQSGTTMTVASANAGAALAVNAGGALTAGGLSATTALSVIGGNAITATALAGSSVLATAATSLSAGTVNATGGTVTLTSANDLSSNPITATGTITLTSTAGGVSVGDLTSTSGAVALTAKTAGSAGAVAAQTGIGMGAGTNLTLTSASTATGNVTLDAGAALASGAVTATAGSVLATAGTSGLLGNITAAGVASGSGINVTAGTTLGVGNAVTAAGTLDLSSTGTLTAGTLGGHAGVTVTGLAGVTVGAVNSANGAATLSATNDLVAGSITAADQIALTSTAGGVKADALTSVNASITANSAGAMDIVSANAATIVSLTSGGVLTAGDLAGVGGVTVNGSGTVTTALLTATGGNVLVTAAGDLATGAISADGLVTLTSSGGGISAGDIRAFGGTVTLSAKNAATAGNAHGFGDVLATSGGNLQLASALSDTSNINLGSTGGSVLAGDLTATAGLVLVSANGSAALGNLSAAGLAGGVGINVTAGTTLSAGNAVVTAGELSLTSGGAMGTGNLTANGGLITATSGGAITAQAVVAATNVSLIATGDLQAGTVTGGGAVQLSGRSVSTSDIRADQSTVDVRATGGSLTAGAITSVTDAALIASGDLAVGAVRARDLVLLGGGNIRAASLTSQNGRILAASNTLGAAGGAIGAFNFNAVFAQPLVAAGGGLTLTGAASGATFTASVTGDAATQGIAASQSILVDAGGTARLGGVWQSPSIELRASDLDLPAGSGLNAGLAGTITLVSRNAAGMRIGDGLDGSVVPTNGFSLDNGEWSRINSGSFNVFAPDVAGPVDILIGKLDVTGPDAGSTIDDPLGAVRFTTGANAAGTFSGTIRVAGALATTGFRATNALVFRTGQFQLASDTGSIAVQGTGGALSGTLRIDARDIHVAASSLLAQLAANPFFAGVEPALDQVSAGGNGPVLRAGALDFTVGRSFYIQRTGNGFDPLGFEEPLDGFKVTQAGAAPIAVIINGTFRTATGVVTGAEAWRQFKASGVNLSGFTADSRLNGCLLSAVTCGVRLEPDPGIRTVIEWADKPKLDDTQFDPENPPLQSKGAIVPPPLLLPVQPDALPGQVDEPIAGSGNPALSAGSGLEGARP